MATEIPLPFLIPKAVEAVINRPPKGRLVSKFMTRRQKRQALAGANTIDNLVRLYQLKEKGILTSEEFADLKEKMMARI